MAEGAFDHLEGFGQPLNLEEDPFEDPSLRMAHRLLKNNGFAPACLLVDVPGGGPLYYVAYTATLVTVRKPMRSYRR
jgi:hypothetical protein